MSPSRILEQCLAEVFSLMHKATLSVVLKAIDALGAGSWLTMTEIARHWPGAQRVAAPLKATDRLLSSPRVAQYRAMLYAGLTRWLIRQDRPLIVVDWSDVKVDGRFRLLRAGLAVDGRTLTLYEEVHSRARSGQVTLETAFLRSLGRLLPPGCRPIVVTDAGFRVPWLRAVKRLGWDYVGRVRGMVKVQRVDPTSSSWELCSALHRLARRDKARELGAYRLSQQTQLQTRLIVHQALRKGRHAKTVTGKVRRDHLSRKAARSAREPWLLASSLSCAEATTRRVVNLYARRMRIEESFRDLKSGDLGVGFEHSRTDKRGRLAHLLLLFALSQLAVWLLGWCEEARGQGGRLEARTTSERKHHSLWRLGLEVIKRPLWWPPASLVHDFLRRVAKACPQRLCTAVEG
jgi:Transposase DDE domain